MISSRLLRRYGAQAVILAAGLVVPVFAAEVAGVPSHLVNPAISPEIKAMVEAGDLTKAREALKQAVSTGDAGSSKALYQAEEARLGYLAREYAVTAEEILEKIKKQIPDATAADVKAWTDDRSLQWIMVDGQVRYFRREPGVLMRFSDAAKKRAGLDSKGGDPAARGGEFSLPAHIAEVVGEASTTKSEFLKPYRFKVEHTVTVKAGAVPEGEMIRCWLPYPQEYRQQKDIKLISSVPADPVVAENGVPQRTLYFEQKSAGDKPTVFKASYEYVNSAYAPDLTTTQVITSGAIADHYLKAEPPHINQTTAVVALAKRLKGAETDPVKIAFNIWDHIERNIKWCPEMEYVVMPDIVEKVMADQRGDCGTQALMFISLCRAAGVPARWQSGWVTKPNAWNMHDWAEFYSSKRGWLPADPSVGRQESADPAVKDFLFGHLDAFRMVANLQHGGQFTPAKEHHRSDPVDNQRGEVEWKDGNLFYDHWSYNVDVSEEPLP